MPTIIVFESISLPPLVLHPSPGFDRESVLRFSFPYVPPEFDEFRGQPNGISTVYVNGEPGPPQGEDDGEDGPRYSEEPDDKLDYGDRVVGGKLREGPAQMLPVEIDQDGGGPEDRREYDMRERARLVIITVCSPHSPYDDETPKEEP